MENKEANCQSADEIFRIRYGVQYYAERDLNTLGGWENILNATVYSLLRNAYIIGYNRGLSEANSRQRYEDDRQQSNLS